MVNAGFVSAALRIIRAFRLFTANEFVVRIAEIVFLARADGDTIEDSTFGVATFAKHQLAWIAAFVLLAMLVILALGVRTTTGLSGRFADAIRVTELALGTTGTVGTDLCASVQDAFLVAGTRTIAVTSSSTDPILASLANWTNGIFGTPYYLSTEDLRIAMEALFALTGSSVIGWRTMSIQSTSRRLLTRIQTLVVNACLFVVTLCV